MKIEIDLNEILRDEYGEGEGLAESIRRQIIREVKESAKKGIDAQINAAVSEAISDGLKTAVSEQMPALITDLMNAEYQPIGKWGDKAAPTTVRNELIKSISENMVYKRASYDSDKNAFTRAVDSTMQELMKQFQKDFITQVDGKFRDEALRVATQSILAKLGVKQS